MKKWNAPSVEELNINETANGKYDSFFEYKSLNPNVLEAIIDFYQKVSNGTGTGDEKVDALS